MVKAILLQKKYLWAAGWVLGAGGDTLLIIFKLNEVNDLSVLLFLIMNHGKLKTK